ncbi:MAG: NAD(P)H-hydrate dehydratase [Brevundimonas sp.]|nr:NAD(P)H-hydrate dehydratase [Brevundimonas sp.]
MTTLLSAAVLSDYPLPRLPVDCDKEDRGAVLVVGGETVMAGAAILAGVAALRVGAGKLQICGQRDALAAMAMAVPEARIVLTRFGKDLGKSLRAAARSSSAIVVGPGMDASPQQQRLARRLLTETSAPTVVDAGALPDVGCAEAFAALSKGRAILTPHAGEMAGMLGRDKAAIKAGPLEAARDAAALFQAVVVMKGATTFIVSPDGIGWRHEGGVSGLGTSGSGDVLAGAIGGLLARGAPPLVSALWGVVLHSEAGDALGRDAPLGFLAREIPAQFPVVLARLCEPSEPSL